MEKTQKVSRLFYLIPIFVFVLGLIIVSYFNEGLIAWITVGLFLPLLSSFILSLIFNKNVNFVRNVVIISIMPVIIFFLIGSIKVNLLQNAEADSTLISLIPFLIFSFSFAIYNSWFLDKKNRIKSLLIFILILALTVFLFWFIPSQIGTACC